MGQVKFRVGLQSNFDAIPVKDPNSIYFIADTQRFYRGDKEFTRPILRGNGAPTATNVTPESLYLDETNACMYVYTKIGTTYSWRLVVNIAELAKFKVDSNNGQGYDSVSDLPNPGEFGVFYLVKSNATPSAGKFEEYIWTQISATEYGYEYMGLFGTVDMDRLNETIQECVDATQAANNASANASSAAALAREARDDANTATTNANTATSKANTATTNANNAASGANTQAQAAASAASSANSAASTANEAADRANTAAEVAETNATNAQQQAQAAASAASSANSAASTANEAAQNAEEATTGAEKVNIAAVQTDTGATVTVTDRNGVNTEVHINTLMAVNTWKDVRDAVRLGLHTKLFPVGYEFTVADSNTGRSDIWVVRDHNHFTPANERLSNSMVLEMKYVYSSSSGSYKTLQFDASEALYYAEDGLSAGTYNFTVANQAWYTADNGKTYQFTLTQAVPVGGQIVLGSTYNASIEGKNVRTYSSADSNTVIETVTTTEGSVGTNLGTTDGSGNVNHMHRIYFGSNNYAQSAARQWFNSSAVAGSVWTAQTKFDRQPSWETSYAGFMNGLDSEFLEVVQPAIIPCRTNSVYECNSLDGTEFTTNQTYNLEDKFFILSRPEIYGTWDSTSYKDGELLEYYNGLTTSELRKFDVGGTARNAWLRSPYPSHAYYERLVHTDGSLNGGSAGYSSGVAPACIIA